ncbi:hypothetical protein ACV3XU_10650 [Clostridium perfringens]
MNFLFKQLDIHVKYNKVDKKATSKGNVINSEGDVKKYKVLK